MNARSPTLAAAVDGMAWRAIRKEERKIAADAESATLELVNMACPLDLLGLAVAAF